MRILFGFWRVQLLNNKMKFIPSQLASSNFIGVRPKINCKSEFSYLRMLVLDPERAVAAGKHVHVVLQASEPICHVGTRSEAFSAVTS